MVPGRGAGQPCLHNKPWNSYWYCGLKLTNTTISRRFSWSKTSTPSFAVCFGVGENSAFFWFFFTANAMNERRGSGGVKETATEVQRDLRCGHTGKGVLSFSRLEKSTLFIATRNWM
ncbi:hypothetical protein SRHO_G00005450 [Serrasalmus rhombeus]